MDGTLRLTDSFESARAPMLAAAVGDALGWPMENRSGIVGGISKLEPRFELTSWRRREGGGYVPHEIEVTTGSYSDDTQLTLAVARSRLRGDSWWDHWTRCELPLWLVYERGGGGASKRAAQAWNKGHEPWSPEAKEKDRSRYFDAGGNGVAMRILPHVLAGASNFKAVAQEVFADGVTTHGHPRALVGAQLHAYCLWLAFRQETPLGFGELVRRALDEESVWGPMPYRDNRLASWDEAAVAERRDFTSTWEQTREEMRKLLETCARSLGAGSLVVDRGTLEELGAFDPKSGGAGTIAAATALYIASRYASRPEQGLLAAAFARGSDTDTIAAMAGSLLGAIDTDDWLADITRDLQDTAYIENLSAALGRGGRSAPAVEAWGMPDRRALWGELDSAEPGVRLNLSVFGSVEVRERREIPTRSANNKITEWTLVTEEGQTLFPKRVASGKAAQRPQATSESAPPEAPPKVDTTSFWLVISVADLDASRHFFVESLRLKVREDRARRLLYLLDRVVLEQADLPTTRTRFSDEEELIRHPTAVTIFLSEREFAELQDRLSATDAPTSGVFDRQGRRAFRTADPDGNVFEFRLTAD
jgi:ADP-ribosylglycohydrolase/catechol 2,3-dioxygenase-like lactoylglutathione lyase family enzyme